MGYGIPATADEFEPSPAPPRVLIVGASTRAAAWSAIRAGARPVCADLFADEDLRQVAEVIPVSDYPASLISDLAQCSAQAWMFTGAMENHRDALRGLDQSGRFGAYCGPTAEAIARLRDPAWLAERLAPQGCYPAIRHSTPMESPATGQPAELWLSKPLCGGGGRGIHREDFSRPLHAALPPCYWQHWISGTSLSAIFVVSAKGCRCLMVSEQLIGCPEVDAPTEFAYCGSIGPWPVSPRQSAQLAEMVEALINGSNYRGLLGVDLIWDGRQFWLIEVNPRYTASCELWDFWSGRSAVGEHLRACGKRCGFDTEDRLSSCEIGGGPRRLDPPYGDGRRLGKLILYADRDLIAPDLNCCLAPRSVWSIPWVADVPASGSLIPAQSPICTVFATAETRSDCRQKLIRRASRVRAWFRAAHSMSASSGP